MSSCITSVLCLCLWKVPEFFTFVDNNELFEDVTSDSGNRSIDNFQVFAEILMIIH